MSKQVGIADVFVGGAFRKEKQNFILQFHDK